MTVMKRQFYRNHKPNGGEVYVIRQADFVVDGGSEKTMPLYEFLAGGGNRQDALLQLIGSLVPESARP